MFRVVKRNEVSRRESIAIRAASVLLALVVSGIFIYAIKLNPLQVYASMLKGSIQHKGNH